MKPLIVKAHSLNLVYTPERCFVAENYGSIDGRVSIAVAIVEPGVTTVAHHLEGIEEIYVITQGRGIVEVRGLEPTEVSVGDIVVIPAGTSQRIKNVGDCNLVFYCVCTPRFSQECYYSDEPATM